MMYCLGSWLFKALVPGIWHRIDWVEKYPGLYTGMKFCSICEYTHIWWYQTLFHSMVLYSVNRYWARELCFNLVGCEETIWLVLCLLICASWLGCGICKFSIPLPFPPRTHPQFFHLLKILEGFSQSIFLYHLQWCKKQQFDWHHSAEYWQLYCLPGLVRASYPVKAKLLKSVNLVIIQNCFFSFEW